MMQDGAMNKTCVGGIHGCPEAMEEMRSGCCRMFEANQHAQIGVGNLWLLLPRKKYVYRFHNCILLLPTSERTAFTTPQ